MLSREYLVLNAADNTVFNKYIGTPLGVDLTQFKVLPYNGEDISTQGLVDTLAASYNEISIQRLKKIVQSEKIANEYLAKGVVYTFPDTIQSQIDCSSAELISDLALKSNLAKQLLDEGVSSGVLTLKDANGRYHTMTPAQYIDLSLFITKRTEKIDAVLGAIYNELQALVTVPNVQAYNVALRFDFLQADAGTDSLIKNTVLNKATTKVDLSSYPGLVQALGFKTASGTLTQFLKADGSLDSKAYLPLTTATASVPVGSPMATDSILGIDSAGNVVRSTVTGGSGGQGGSVGWVLKTEYTVDLPAISQNTENTYNITVTGAALKDTVIITPPPTLPKYILVVGTVTATDTVTMTVRNLGSYHDQVSSVFTVAVIKDASYLPKASETIAGLIKVGSGLAIDGNGVLSSTGGGGGTSLSGTGFVSMSGATPSYITGTASQFLKADGSLDSSSYVSSTGDSTIDGNKSFTGSTSINKATTTGAPSFLTTTASGTESLSWRYTEDAVGVVPANVWQLRSGGGSARALVVSGYDSAIWSTTSSTGIDTVGLTAASSSISGATSTGSLKIGNSSIAGQVWTATDTLGNGGWQTLSGSYTLPTATAGTLGGIKIGSGLSIDGAGVVSAAGGGGDTFSTVVTSSVGFKTPSGTSTQFLKADGTVDSTSYASLAAANFTGAVSSTDISVSKAAGTTRSFKLSTNGVSRWNINANLIAESGADAGSNFALVAYSDAGTLIDAVMNVVRAAGGGISFPVGRPFSTGPLTATTGSFTGGSLGVSASSGTVRSIRFKTSAVDRWGLNVDAGTETGTNGVGSDFTLTAYNDSGAAFDNPLSIARIPGGTIAFSAARPVTTGPLRPTSLKIGSSSTAGQVWTATDATGNGAWLPSASGGSFTLVSISQEVIGGSRLLVDTSAAAVVITLPGSPAVGNSVEVVDAKATGSFSVNKCTIAGNGKNIQGLSEDMDITDAGASVGLVYNGTEWRLF